MEINECSWTSVLDRMYFDLKFTQCDMHRASMACIRYVHKWNNSKHHSLSHYTTNNTINYNKNNNIAVWKWPCEGHDRSNIIFLHFHHHHQQFLFSSLYTICKRTNVMRWMIRCVVWYRENKKKWYIMWLELVHIQSDISEDMLMEWHSIALLCIRI